MNVYREITTMNPLTSWSVQDSLSTIPTLYNSLIYFDEFLNPKPELAQSWEISSDFKTYTFHLVRNASWHDGVAFTSADVKFSFKAVVLTHPLGASNFGIVESVETPDDYTVIVHLSTSTPWFLKLLAPPWIPIVPSHIYDRAGEYKREYMTEHPRSTGAEPPIGTGPFIFEEWVKGSHVSFKRNANYWKEGLPYLDRVVVRITPDATAADAMFKAGELDYMPYSVQPAQIVELRDLPFAKWAAHPDALMVWTNLMLNQKQDGPYAKYLRNEKVRQAVHYAINIDDVVKRGGLGLRRPIPTDRWFPAWDGLKPYLAPQLSTKFTYNPAMAEKLLDEAGFPKGADGTRFAMEVITLPEVDAAKYAELAIEYLRAVGIKAELKAVAAPTYLELVYVKGEYGIAAAFLWLGPVPETVARGHWHSSAAHLPFSDGLWYTHPRVEELLDKALGELDASKRYSYFHEIEDIMNTESYYTPLGYDDYYTVWNDRDFGNIRPEKYPWGGRETSGTLEAFYWKQGTPATTTEPTTSAPTAVPQFDATAIAAAVIAVVVVALIGAYAFTRRRKTEGTT